MTHTIQNFALKDWETKAYGYFLSVMNKQQAIRHCFSDARMALECLVTNFLKESSNKQVSDLRTAIDELNGLKVLPNEGLFHTMHFIRKVGNGQVHPKDEYNIELLNTIRLSLLSIFKWYFIQIKNYRHYKRELDDLTRTMTNIKEDPLLYMFRTGSFSEEAIENRISKKPSNPRGVKLESTRTPIFGVFVIDMSGSMEPYKQDVIQAHKEAIEALRGSAICISKQFYLTQYVFNDTVHLPLNQLEILRNEGKDLVISLNNNNYNPTGYTALYDTLEVAINNIYDEIATIRKNDSRKAQLSIAIITDGDDNNSKFSNSNKIKLLMQNLLENKYHYSSVVIGLTDPKTFSAQKLEEMRKQLGFSESIAIEFSEKEEQQRRKKIREAFRLGSQKLSGK